MSIERGGNPDVLKAYELACNGYNFLRIKDVCLVSRFGHTSLLINVGIGNVKVLDAGRVCLSNKVDLDILGSAMPIGYSRIHDEERRITEEMFSYGRSNELISIAIGDLSNSSSFTIAEW